MHRIIALVLLFIVVIPPIQPSECNVAISLGEVKDLISGSPILSPPPWYKRATANGIKVGIVDTGIDPSHPDMPLIDSRHFRDLVNGKRDPYDDVGHGTHLAGIIAGCGHIQLNPFHAYFPSGCVGIARGAELYIAKALEAVKEDGEVVGRGNIQSLVDAINWLRDPDGDGNTSDGVDVINLSVGIVGDTPPFFYDPIMKRLEAAIKGGIAEGVVFVIAAGNHDADDETYIIPPADMGEVITVGGIGLDGTICEFSNVGGDGKPDLVAPAAIASTYPTHLDYGIADGYVGLGGTSMAAAVVTGAIAVLMASSPSLRSRSSMSESAYGDRASYVKEMLTRNCKDIGLDGPDNIYGYGLLDFGACYWGLGAPHPEWNGRFFSILTPIILIICVVILFKVRRKKRESEMEDIDQDLEDEYEAL